MAEDISRQLSDKEMPDYALFRVKNRIMELMNKALDREAEIRLEYPPSGIEADFAIPCFPYARIFRKNPALIAKDLAEKINGYGDEIIEKAESVKGYLNIKINHRVYFDSIFKDLEALGEGYGDALMGNGRAVCLDFSSPNIAKPFSVGNVRSTIIGQAVYNIYNTLGYKMVGINHLGDWGTQFGKLIYAYQMWGDEEKIQKDPIRELLNLYVRFHRECKRQRTIEPQEDAGADDMDILDEIYGEAVEGAAVPMEEEARKRFRMLEEGVPEVVHLWKWFVEISLQDFNRIYDRLGVKFDFVQGESFYMDKTDSIIKMVEDLKIARREDSGALLAPLDDYGIETPLLLQKSDGATLYATRELAELIYRTRKFDPVLLLYAVGSEQKLHFKQCFQVYHLLGFNTECHHIDFGMVSLKEGKMSTREGRVIFFEDVMNEAKRRVMDILKEKRPDISPEEKEEISEVVGIGAIKFNDLSQNRIKNVVFDWDHMLSFDGDTAPYLQYSYARVSSILSKSQAAPRYDGGLLREKEEIELMKGIARFPEVIIEAAERFTPHVIAQYLLNTSKLFTSFYSSVPVLKAGSDDLVSARLGLIRAYSIVIKKGLWLLGIKVLSRM